MYQRDLIALHVDQQIVNISDKMMIKYEESIIRNNEARTETPGVGTVYRDKYLLRSAYGNVFTYMYGKLAEEVLLHMEVF